MLYNYVSPTEQQQPSPLLSSRIGLQVSLSLVSECFSEWGYDQLALVDSNSQCE